MQWLDIGSPSLSMQQLAPPVHVDALGVCDVPEVLEESFKEVVARFSAVMAPSVRQRCVELAQDLAAEEDGCIAACQVGCVGGMWGGGVGCVCGVWGVVVCGGRGVVVWGVEVCGGREVALPPVACVTYT